MAVSYDVEAIQHNGRRIMRVCLLSNLIGALVVFAYLNALPSAGGDPVEDARDLAFYGVAFIALGLIGGPFAAFVGHRLAHRSCRWYIDEPPRMPTAREGALTLRAPWDQAVSAFAFWVAAAAVFGVLIIVRDANAGVALRVGVGIVLGGVSTCALMFLMVERAMRPEFAVVLAHHGLGRSTTAGIRPRLLVSWLLGSAIPLVALGLAPIGLNANGRAVLGDRLWFFVVVGVVAGGLATWVAARSVADPLDSLRDAMRRVEDDDLDIAVDVDDGGEVGLLQNGFNRMVAGLRDRQRVRDLFGRHVGTEVAREALEGDGALGGQRREVSVLFVDLVGSTALAQTRSPDDVLAILNAFFETVVTRVGAEGGWVNKFEGDGALCVFGAPADQADHAARALRAARTLRRELLVLGARHPGLDAAIGVSSGGAVAGNVGSVERYEYTVLGDPVNEASRLTDEAKQRLGRVLASDESIERAGTEAVHWAVSDEIHLRGRAQPTLAYEPVLLDIGARVDDASS